MTPALAVSLAWSLAVAAAIVLLPAAPLLGIVAAAAGLLSLGASLVVRPLLLPLALAGALLGVARVELPAAPPPLGDLQIYAGRNAAVAGRVVDDPSPAGPGVSIIVQPAALQISGAAANQAGDLIVITRHRSRVAAGDEITAYGRLRLPANLPGFDRRAYLRSRNVYLELDAAQLDVTATAPWYEKLPAEIRSGYRQAIASLLPRPHSTLLLGIVLGLKTGIPRRLDDDLIATGLVHLLVLSGLKVAVFARLATAALRPLLGRAATGPALALIALYALAGGATPAAVRAAAMGGVALLGAGAGRPAHAWTSLSLVAAAMLAWHPEVAWDVGFQLSFAGTAAILVLTRPLEERLQFLPAIWREPLAVTFAAQVGTLPFMATDFHLLSPLAPITNALTLPLLPFLIAAGLLLGPAALVPGLGQVLALPVVALLAYVEQVAELFARAPLATISVPSFPASGGVAYYAALLGGLVAVRSGGRRRLLAASCSLLFPALVAAGEFAAWSFSSPTAAVLAVGDGQAVLLSGPEGAILIDGGASPSRLADELGQHLPPWERSLAALALTAPGRGHVAGLAGFKLPATYLLMPGTHLAGSAWRQAAYLAVARGAQPLRLTAGRRLRIAGFWLDVLAPEPDDPGDEPGAGYLALRITGSNGRSFCDLSDLDPEAQATAAQHLHGACDYLLLPSGGKTAPAAEMLAASRRGELIASTAGGQVARELGGWPLARTDQDGTVVVQL